MSYVDGGTFNSAAAAVTTFNWTVPGTVQLGDTVVLIVCEPGTVATTCVVSQSGATWTTDADMVTVGTMHMSVLHHTITSGEGGTVTVNIGPAGRLITAAWAYYREGAVDVVGPFTPRPASQVTTTAPSQTVARSGETVVCLFGEKTTPATTIGYSVGTQRQFSEATSGAICSVAIVDFPAPSTISGDCIATYNNPANTNGAALQIAMVPATTPVQQDSAQTWVVRATVTAATAQTWVVRALATAAAAEAWVVRALVQADAAESWTVRAGVAAPAAETWTVRALTQADAAESWVVRGVVIAPAAESWTVRAAVQADAVETWMVKAAAQQDSAQTWTIRAGVTTPSAQSWVVRQLVRADVLATWMVKALVQVDAVETWKVGDVAAPPPGDNHAVYGGGNHGVPAAGRNNATQTGGQNHVRMSA